MKSADRRLSALVERLAAGSVQACSQSSWTRADASWRGSVVALDGHWSPYWVPLSDRNDCGPLWHASICQRQPHLVSGRAERWPRW
jgi:hypothetical protein